MRTAIAAVSLAMCSTTFATTLDNTVEGSNIVDVVEVSSNNFTCRVRNPPRPTPEAVSDPAHTSAKFFFKIVDAAGQTVTIRITNYTAGTPRGGGRGVYSQVLDPYAVSSQDSWQRLTNVTYNSPELTIVVTPSEDQMWIADGYPVSPTTTNNWIDEQLLSPYVTVTTAAVTSQGRDLQMVFVTDNAYPLVGKKGVVVYGLEHNQEPTGGWTAQGLVEFLTSGDLVAQSLLQNTVFMVIPDMGPDATAEGLQHDPQDGRDAQWRYNPAAVERLMPGMITPMTAEAMGIMRTFAAHVQSGGQIDFCFNVHEGGQNNFWGAYELADPISDNFDGFLNSYMPVSGASWVPNALQGYSRGDWIDYDPRGVFASRLVGRLWYEWRSTAMGYEISHGLNSSNFLTSVDGLKYFGEAIARSIHDYYGQFDKSLTLTAPTGGQAYSSGESVAVTWSSSGVTDGIRIDVSVDGGNTWQNRVSSTGNDGAHTLTLPAANSDACLLRISSASAFGVSDQSEEFSIGSAPSGTLTLTDPGGGETWYAGWMETVTWQSTGSIANVDIEISLDNGASWKPIGRAVENNGTYVVNVPDQVSSQALVRLTGVENRSVISSSATTFTIEPQPAWPSLTLLAPNGGEQWTPGDTATVTWSSAGTFVQPVTSVGISISTDQGASWTTLLGSTANDGSAQVTVPSVQSQRCLLWIYDARNDPFVSRPDADPMDVSDDMFIIGDAVDAAVPDVTVPDTAAPDVVDAAVPDVVAPDAAAPDVTDAAVPDVTVPDIAAPDVVDAAVPDVTVPDTAAPDVADAAVGDSAVADGVVNDAVVVLADATVANDTSTGDTFVGNDVNTADSAAYDVPRSDTVPSDRAANDAAVNDTAIGLDSATAVQDTATAVRDSAAADIASADDVVTMDALNVDTWHKPDARENADIIVGEGCGCSTGLHGSPAWFILLLLPLWRRRTA